MTDETTMNDQKPAVIFALEICEIVGAGERESSTQKVAEILAELCGLETEWIGDASGITMALKAALTGLGRQSFRGTEGEDCPAEIIAALITLADKATDIIDKNTAFISLQEAMTANGSAALN